MHLSLTQKFERKSQDFYAMWNKEQARQLKIEILPGMYIPMYTYSCIGTSMLDQLFKKNLIQMKRKCLCK